MSEQYSNEECLEMLDAMEIGIALKEYTPEEESTE